VPPLLREHLSVLRAFLIAMRDLPPQQAHVQERQQQAAAAANSKLDPLDPPQPIWETEAEQVGLISIMECIMSSHSVSCQLCLVFCELL
jgi:hypothetical protein